MNLISVIIPSYNTEKTIARCIESILAQTYQNFEIVIVDDGSDDTSPSIIAGYAASDVRIRMFSKKHGGVSTARNKGLEEARGDFIQFVDGDDFLRRDSFEKMLQAIIKTGSDICICQYNHPFFKTFIGDKIYDLTDERQFMDLYNDTYAEVMPWNKLTKAEFCRGERFDEDVRFSEDELFNLAMLTKMKKAVTLSDVLYTYSFVKSTDASEAKSTINNIINSEDFWVNKTSFWFLGNLLKDKRRTYIEKGIKEGTLHIKDPEDAVWSRTNDYLYWEMVAFFGMKVPNRFLYLETENILRDPDFVVSAKVAEKHGLRYLDFKGSRLAEACRLWIDTCVKAYADIVPGKPQIKEGFVVQDLFVKIFYRQAGELDGLNPLARHQQELNDNSTPEAVYVNSLRL